MANLDSLKKRITSEAKPESKKKQEEETREIDMDKVDKIVKRMRDKYRSEGVEFGEARGVLKELRGIIVEGQGAEIEIQSVEDLKEFKSRGIQSLAKVYLKLGKILKPIANAINKFPEMEMLTFYLYSANMRYSNKQYLALTVASSAIAFLVSLVLSLAALTILNVSLATRALLAIITPVMAFIISTVVILMIPKQKAVARGNRVSAELPFALRHMSTELRAGIGLYKTIQTIATADYGALSEEFSQVITEVEEGVDTQDALRHLALRTQSKALRNAAIHITRALKTGGNLSEAMTDIAEDVSFEMRASIADFGHRMNFLGVLFIFGAIVLPVMVSVLGAVRNSPLQTTTLGLSMIPLTVPVIAAVYLAVIPFILIVFVVYIKIAQPRV
ncbi:MAG: type II secretion system F family protein [Candidatus Diapherotrites archaeon]|uniref:Type II secretion system F family protein n=1 Tax=Candidatus Iainarchaeum sp. TaxID=3101447 RepID=A0A939C7T7_9ARCH|nr:type II secretion system F family protein [Candidatus Diapherotrites archaeon]